MKSRLIALALSAFLAAAIPTAVVSGNGKCHAKCGNQACVTCPNPNGVCSPENCPCYNACKQYGCKANCPAPNNACKRQCGQVSCAYPNASAFVDGKVASIDESGKSFKLDTGKDTLNVHSTKDTVFKMGRTGASSFKNLKIGQTVRVAGEQKDKTVTAAMVNIRYRGQ